MLLRTTVNFRFADLITILSPSSWTHTDTLWLRTILCAMLCASPYLAEAVQIGEVISLSKLGAPLRVEVAFTAAPNEKIDNSCISLVAPDNNAEDARHYVQDAKPTLLIDVDGGPQHILLNTHKAFNEVFAKFKLQIKCRDQGSIAKIFTVLLDIDESALSPESKIAATEQIAPQVSPGSQSAIQAQQSSVAIAPSSSPNASAAASTTNSHHLTKQASHSISQSLVVRHARTGNLGGFQLKISGEPLNTSRIGKISEEERAFLLASQKLLDSDDQMASILTLQNQVKQLQDDIGEMRAKLSLLDAAPAYINPGSASNLTTKGASEADAVATIKPVSAQKTLLPKKSDWRTWSWQLGLLGLAILGVIWGLRRYSRAKSARTPLQLWPEINQAEPTQTKPAGAVTPLQIKQPTPSIIPDYVITELIEENPVKPTPSLTIPYFKSATHSQSNVADTESNVNDLIEEAHLYATHNHPHRAIKILQELITEHPKINEAWLLLFAIFSSLNQTTEFEKNVHNFLRHNSKDDKSWKTIQALGRTLDSALPLYQDTTPPVTPSNVLGDRHLIGDVLIDLNMLLPEELHHCLANFDPNQHGRLGAYLVTQGSITHEQLTQALIHQQTLNQGVIYMPKPPVVSPPPDVTFEWPENN